MKKFLFLICTLLPLAAFSQIHLKMEFTTGGDDLRGGNDNANVVVIMNNGKQVRFDNVNAKAKWPNNSVRVVERTIPQPAHFKDIKGVRVETTFSGGIGGDNWNLNKLTITGKTGADEVRLYSQSGNPLFRFTGDRRTKEFLFSPAPITPARAVMTNFKPEEHGFKFVNRFKNNFVSELDIRTSGLCGGMAYSALDYFFNRMSIPKQTFQPAEGTTLQSYIYGRQVTSIEKNADKWTELGFNPGGARNREFFNWGLQFGSGRLGELMKKIDAGHPVPLGLQSCGDGCGCKKDECPGSHQVIAVGYKIGRYNGDLKNHIGDVQIYIYDPNHPNSTQILVPNPTGAYYYYRSNPSKKWRSYFVDYKYAMKRPPVISDGAREIVVEFKTGNDDLRGGNDNVDLILLLSNGKEVVFRNVNDSKRWINGSSQTVVRELPAGVSPDQVVGVRIRTSFTGGISGDNWNLDAIEVMTRVDGGATTRKFKKSGSPLFRFTGEKRQKVFNF